MTDIVDFILVTVQEVDKDFTVEQAKKVEQVVRTRFGGDRCYIKQTCKRPEKEKLIQDYLAMPVNQAARRNGISRSTLYRMLKK